MAKEIDPNIADLQKAADAGTVPTGQEAVTRTALAALQRRLTSANNRQWCIEQAVKIATSCPHNVADVMALARGFYEFMQEGREDGA